MCTPEDARIFLFFVVAVLVGLIYFATRPSKQKREEKKSPPEVDIPSSTPTWPALGDDFDTRYQNLALINAAMDNSPPQGFTPTVDPAKYADFDSATTKNDNPSPCTNSGDDFGSGNDSVSCAPTTND